MALQQSETDAQFPSGWARSAPGKPAVIVLDEELAEVQRLSYAELDSRSIRVALLLRAEGLTPGRHIAVLMENRAEIFEVCWAAQRLGLYVTVVNTHLGVEEAGYVVDDCEAAVLFTSARMAQLASEIVATTPNVRRRLMVDRAAVEVGGDHEDYESALAEVPDGPLADQCEGDTMLYSSGTTGRPKGVKRPLALGPIGSGFRLRAMFELMGYDESVVYLSPAPLYHAAPLGYTMAVHRVGGTVLVMRRFDAHNALRLIERFRVTHAQFVPTMFIRMIKLPTEVLAHADVSSLRSVVHAAAPCPVELKRRMIDWWGPILWEYYAGTEGNGSTLISSAEWLAHPGSVGRAVIGSVRILDPDGASVAVGETGTVYFADGPRFEYHNAPEKTAGSYARDGWSTLGDVGHVDEDGYLYLTDRLSNMIISGGVNIYPQETENVLTMHPSVADAAVIGIPDPEMGEQVKAVVQLVDPNAGTPELSAALIDYCRSRLAHYKCPRVVEFTEALPRQDNGKLYKRLLR
ncbi:acyl-CoA synthetase [Pseudonocardia spinosispora]|uniref:acyl-CoA synthetase n=1 Tax=Pseudonocardia spinosispora TaxID=103441 RepID=UPI000414CDB7|nr:acyl-CoA synthetase [Pseudonocardia spinosispora]